MNLINSNIKKSVFGAVAVSLALGFSAYTSAEKTNTNRATTYYALNQAGTFYRLIGPLDPSSDCEPGTSLPCVIEYASEVDPDGFTPQDRPEDGIDLGDDGYVPEL